MKGILAVAITAVLAAGCGAMGLGDGGASATANLEPTKGNNARGTVKFTQHGDKVRVSGQISGLQPGAEHGFHMHEKGDCSSGDGMSAGGHFNPAGKPHGPQSGDHHGGDMPNLKADASGMAKADFEISGVSIGSGSADIAGKGLIVHKDPDDYKTQPTGNAGPRIACGVIKAA